jgi:hypothetical protein
MSGMTEATVIAVVAALGIGCSKSEAAPPLPAPSPSVLATAAAPKEPTVVERLMESTTLTEALGVARPLFTDTEDKVDPAAVSFAMWAAKRMTWRELQALPETKHALVMKDPEAERGKRNCYTGVIVEIQVDRSKGVPLYLGGLMTNGGQIARFAAVGSTGELVQKSAARFCGVTTGRQSYSNAGGGTTHAVYLVGMFDLPENKLTR